MKRHPERPSPVAVLVRRGERVESWHRVSYAIADGSGRRRHAAGEPARLIYPRSAVKPLQALVLLESGAAERFAVSQAELALACASHGGEPLHVEAIRRWLGRLGIDPSALECGAHPPLHGPSAERLVMARAGPRAGAQQLLGQAHRDAGDSPAIWARRSPATPRRTTRCSCGSPRRWPRWRASTRCRRRRTDGCGLPTYPLTLDQLATAMARLADPEGLGPARSAACRASARRWLPIPKLVAGSGRACTAIMTVAPEVVVKTGAEGVYGAALPRLGLGLALKVEDGASRAAPVALLALLAALGALGPEQIGALDELARPVLRNHAGRVVGRIEPADGWPEAIR